MDPMADDGLTFGEFTAVLRDELLGKYPGPLAPETHLFTDVGLDSLEMFHIVVLIEDLTGREISLDDPPPIETVQHAYSFYRAVNGAGDARLPSGR